MLKFKKQSLSLLMVLTLLVSLVDKAMSQKVTVPKDTSFALYSTYVKTKKAYPNIQMVSEAMPKKVKAKKDIAYCVVNSSRSLSLDVFHPSRKVKKGYPAVILIHGGGWRSGDRSQNVPLAQQLAKNGYVAVNVEYRLSTEALYPAAVQDVKAAIRWTRANANSYRIDTSKIAVLGFSAGGQLASLIGTTNGMKKFDEGNTCNSTYSSKVQAIVDLDGTLAFIHPESGEGDDSKGKSAATLWFGVPKAENPALWHEAGALNHVSPQTPPILFINSSVARMHAGRTDMIGKLNQYNIYSEVQSFPEAPHVFPLFHPWFNDTVKYTVNFLDKVLKGSSN
ncbi:alpha/beta hydrolase [Desertivirga brevis]|uniref:alpha/beta hydrolase n=1 Tax=Desertivirga brevis TaxID=2810310 RepID=UPI001A96B623|nr:alpha/beta hydrolase [Pedobacter sp. SYSU D00873]